MSRSIRWQVIALAVLAALPFLIAFNTTWAASPTPKQIDAYGLYVGKTYWIAGEENKTPAFQSAPSPAASSIRPAPKESFEIKEIVGGASAPYFKVAFESGKEGFIPVGSFMHQLNDSIVTVDPDRDAKSKLAKETEAEKKRQAWIRAQKWPAYVKEAALNRQPVLGMDTKEATAVLGKPKSMLTMNNANLLMGRQVQWTYDNGLVLTFTNGFITRIELAANTTPPSTSQPR